MEPVVDRLRTEFEGRVDFRLHNFDRDADAGAIGDQYDVQYVPTFVLLDARGEVVERVVGTMTDEEMRGLLESLE